MKKKDLSDLRTKDDSELGKLCLKKKEELVKVKVDMASGGEKNVKKAKNLRKDIAQILSLLKEKDIIKSLKETE